MHHLPFPRRAGLGAAGYATCGDSSGSEMQPGPRARGASASPGNAGAGTGTDARAAAAAAAAALGGHEDDEGRRLCGARFRSLAPDEPAQARWVHDRTAPLYAPGSRAVASRTAAGLDTPRSWAANGPAQVACALPASCPHLPGRFPSLFLSLRYRAFLPFHPRYPTLVGQVCASTTRPHPHPPTPPTPPAHPQGPSYDVVYSMTMMFNIIVMEYCEGGTLRVRPVGWARVGPSLPYCPTARAGRRGPVPRRSTKKAFPGLTFAGPRVPRAAGRGGAGAVPPAPRGRRRQRRRQHGRRRGGA
jgi:hypothetical protein